VDLIFPKGQEKTKITFPKGDYDAFVIDAHKVLPDVYGQNEEVKGNGKFADYFPIKPLNLIENKKKPVMFGLLPATAYNFYDKWQLGPVIYTSLFPFGS